jgi:hypothetical protein
MLSLGSSSKTTGCPPTVTLEAERAPENVALVAAMGPATVN